MVQSRAGGGTPGNLSVLSTKSHAAGSPLSWTAKEVEANLLSGRLEPELVLRVLQRSLMTSLEGAINISEGGERRYMVENANTFRGKQRFMLGCSNRMYMHGIVGMH